jgi:hypothetical protein
VRLLQGAMSQVPGIDFANVHKPKQKITDKLQRLCQCGATKTVLAPAIFAASIAFQLKRRQENRERGWPV